MCLLGVLCFVVRVLFAVLAASLWCAHPYIRTATFHSQQVLGTLWARTRPSGQGLFRSPQGLGSLPGAHESIWTAAV